MSSGQIQDLTAAIEGLWTRFMARLSVGTASDTEFLLSWQGGTYDPRTVPPTLTFAHSFNDGLPQLNGPNWTIWTGETQTHLVSHPPGALSSAAYIGKEQWRLSFPVVEGTGGTFSGETDCGYVQTDELTGVITYARLTPAYYRSFRSLQQFVDDFCTKFVPMEHEGDRTYEAWNHAAFCYYQWDGLWAADGGARDDAHFPGGRDNSLPARIGSPFVAHPRPDPDPGETAHPTQWQWPRAAIARLTHLYPVTWFQPHNYSEFDIAGNETAHLSTDPAFAGTSSGGSVTTLEDSSTNFDDTWEHNPDDRCLIVTRSSAGAGAMPAKLYLRIRSHTSTTLTFDRIAHPIEAGWSYVVRAGGVDNTEAHPWDIGVAPIGGYAEDRAYQHYYGWESCPVSTSDYVLYCGDNMEITSYAADCGWDRFLPQAYGLVHPGWQWRSQTWTSRSFPALPDPAAMQGSVSACGTGWIVDEEQDWQSLDPIAGGVDARPARWQGRYLVFPDPEDPNTEYWAQITWNQWSCLSYSWKATCSINPETGAESFAAGVVAVPEVGWAYRIVEYRPPVVLWNQAGVWRPIPEDATDPRTGNPFGHNLSILPTIAGNYLAENSPHTRRATAEGKGRMQQCDLITGTLVRALNRAFDELNWIMGSADWLAAENRTGSFGTGTQSTLFADWEHWWEVTAGNAEYGVPGVSWKWFNPGDPLDPNDSLRYLAAAPKQFYSGTVGVARLYAPDKYSFEVGASLVHQGGVLTGWSPTVYVTPTITSNTPAALETEPVVHDVAPGLDLYCYAVIPEEVPEWDETCPYVQDKWHKVHSDSTQHFSYEVETATQPPRPDMPAPAEPPPTNGHWVGKGYSVVGTVCIAKFALP